MIARNENIHSQSSSNLKKSHSKSMAIKIADSAIIDLVQPPLHSHCTDSTVLMFETGINMKQARALKI